MFPFLVLAVIDGFKSADTKDLQRQAEEGARWGFTGKQIIHPAQADIVQAAFSPSKEKLQWAQELIEAFQKHQQLGQVRKSRGIELAIS